MKYRDIGTDDPRVRVRPARGSAPRTKRRPSYADATPALIVAIDRGRYTALSDTGVTITAVKARELRREAVIIGDRVGLVGDVSGAKDTLARIVTVQERTSTLRRSAEEGEQSGVEKPIVANADRVVVVTAAADPPPSPGMVDRCVAAAEAEGIVPVICLTKLDLDPHSDFLRPYQEAGIQTFSVTTVTSDTSAIDALRTYLTGHFTVLIGHSGVGKSSLINALVPGSERVVGRVNTVTGKGRHTSTSSAALELPGGGWVVDTPGIRAFGLAHLDAEALLRGFRELHLIAADCPRGCTHLDDETTCELDKHPEVQGRLASFRKLLAALKPTV